MELDVLDLIDLIVVVLSVLFAVFLITAKTENYTCNLLLALFLIFDAIDSGAGYIGDFVYPFYPGLGLLISSTIYFKLPVLLLYFLSVIYSDFKLRLIHLLHGIPWLLVIGVFMSNYFLVSYEEKITFINAVDYTSIPEIKFTYLFIHFQVTVYFVVIFYYVFRYKKLLLENYSNASMFNYHWMFQFVFLMTLASFIASFKNLFMFMNMEQAYEISNVITSIAVFIFICWLVLRALQAPELFRGIDSNLQLVKQMVKESVGADKVLEDELDDEVHEKIQLLKDFMIKEEPYLNASLSLFDLARQLKISSRELSLLINHQLNRHFFDFINEYRVEKAKELLRNSDRKKFTISEILYKVGFNSKSSFNTAFKKYTGMTPTQYRLKCFKSMA